jgi:hypothetical protein
MQKTACTLGADGACGVGRDMLLARCHLLPACVLALALGSDGGFDARPGLGPAGHGRGQQCIGEQQVPAGTDREQLGQMQIVAASQPRLPALPRAGGGPTVEVEQPGRQAGGPPVFGHAQARERVADGRHRVARQPPDRCQRRGTPLRPVEPAVGRHAHEPASVEPAVVAVHRHVPAGLPGVEVRRAVLADLVHDDVAPPGQVGDQRAPLHGSVRQQAHSGQHADRGRGFLDRAVDPAPMRVDGDEAVEWPARCDAVAGLRHRLGEPVGLVVDEVQVGVHQRAPAKVDEVGSAEAGASGTGQRASSARLTRSST